MYTLYNTREILGNDDFLLLESDLIFEKQAIMSLLECPAADAMLIAPVTKFQDQYYVEHDDNFRLSSCSVNKKDVYKRQVHSVSFRQVTRERLRRYEQHLYECGLKPNTISTYMRMLRSIYNRGVEAGSAPYVHRLFHEVYTGVDVRQKRALPVVALRRLLYEDPQSDRLRRTQAIAALMFQFCGMSFADLSHLEKSALDSNVLR